MPDYNEADVDVMRSTLSKFEGRLPDPAELIAWGGLPGVRYAMVAGHNVPEAKDMGWHLCRDVASITLVGPKGHVELVVMARGEPILGASPANGIRQWDYDPQLLSITGLNAPHTPDPEAEQLLADTRDLQARAAAEAKRAAQQAAKAAASKAT